MRALKWVLPVLLAISGALPAAEPDWAALRESVVAQAQEGRLEEARKTGEQSVEVARREFGNDDRRTADSLALLGEVLMLLEDWKQAEVVLDEATAIRLRVLKPGDPDLEQSDNLMARVRVAQGRFDEAERLQLKSLVAAEKAAEAGEMGPQAPRWTDVIATLGALAQFHEERKDRPKARAMRKRAVDALARYAKDDEDRLSRLGTLVDDAINQGDDADAEALAQERVRIAERLVGKDHYQYALAIRQHASMRLQLADRPGSNRLYDQALAVAEKALEPDDPRLAPFLEDAGYIEVESTYDRAESLRKRALALYEAADPPDSAAIIGSAAGLARVYEYQERPELAEPLRRKIIALEDARPGADEASLSPSVLDLADNLFQQRKWPEAGKQYRRVQAARTAAELAEDVQRFPSLQRMVETWVRLGDFAEAARAWGGVAELRQEQYGEHDARVAAAYRDLAALQRVAGDADAARDSERRATSASSAGTKPGAATRTASIPDYLQPEFDRNLSETLLPVLAEIERGEAADAGSEASIIELRGELHLTTASVQLAASEYEKALSIRLGGEGKGGKDARRSAERLAEIYRMLGKADLARDALERAGVG